MRDIEEVWVDYTVQRVHWNRLISELREDWERSATPASTTSGVH